jgi:Peptidase family S41
MKLKIVVRLFLAAVCVSCAEIRGTTAEQPLDFKEVYELLRANLAGTEEGTLDQAAAQGLIAKLYPRVTLLTDGNSASSVTNPPAEIKTAVLEGAYGYLRVGQIGPASEKQLAPAYKELVSTNKLKGLVVDLRFASGYDYAEAAAFADWFFSTEQPLLDWGQGLKKSTSKTNAVSIPVTLLVNRQTSGAAEAFAGILRQADIGVLIGTTTSGQASITKDFTLKTGQKLRIAAAPIKVGDGQALPLTGLKPDIQVEVSPEDERVYFADAYKTIARTNRLASAQGVSTNETLAGTNRLRRKVNEAELVRMMREGQNIELEPTLGLKESDPLRPLVQDPALARAIDLLKGLAVVQQFRSI